MPIAALPALFTFMFITSFTPGPNNILALSSVGRYGFRKSSRILAGICASFFCVMLLCGAITLSINSLSESVITVIKYIGCAYMVWLAWKIASAPPVNEAGDTTDMHFLSGFVLQFVNIKIIVYGITVFSGFLLPHSGSLQAVFLFVLMLTFMGAAGTISWALAGVVFQRFFTCHARIANAVMGALLLACALSLLT